MRHDALLAMCDSERIVGYLVVDRIRNENSASQLVARCVHVSPKGFFVQVTFLLTGMHALACQYSVSDVFEAIAAPVRRAIPDELVDRDGQTRFELSTRWL